MSESSTSTPNQGRSGTRARVSSSASPGGSGDREGPAVRAYCRCNSGHYFQGEVCPFDGWSSAASRELAAAVDRLNREGEQVSVAALRKAGVSRATIEHTVVLEFGSDASIFEALAVKEYV